MRLSVSLCAEQHLLEERVVETVYSPRSQFALPNKHLPSFDEHKRLAEEPQSPDQQQHLQQRHKSLFYPRRECDKGATVPHGSGGGSCQARQVPRVLCRLPVLVLSHCKPGLRRWGKDKDLKNNRRTLLGSVQMLSERAETYTPVQQSCALLAISCYCPKQASGGHSACSKQQQDLHASCASSIYTSFKTHRFPKSLNLS